MCSKEFNYTISFGTCIHLKRLCDKQNGFLLFITKAAEKRNLCAPIPRVHAKLTLLGNSLQLGLAYHGSFVSFDISVIIVFPPFLSLLIIQVDLLAPLAVTLMSAIL